MNGGRVSALLSRMEGAGGIGTKYQGQTLIRHFGDPAEEYLAATERSAVFDRSHRSRLVVSGRAPGQMLNGILSGQMPRALMESDQGVFSSSATYHAVLTPKGKMLTDLWLILLGDEETSGFLLDVPVAGEEPLLKNFGKLLPPRLAVVEDASDRLATITVVGPDSAEALSDLALGNKVTAEELCGLGEGEWCSIGSPAQSLLVMRTGDVWPEAYSVLGPTDLVTELWGALVVGGAQPAGLGVWSTLRVEAGRPAFGTDMDNKTIPVEAGIENRAIDHTKGCYTGQEVIVRIRDRGHVNRSLKRLELGDMPTPAKGQELFANDGTERPVGWITSAVESPRYGEVLALAYVKQGLETVILDGQEVAVPA